MLCQKISWQYYDEMHTQGKKAAPQHNVCLTSQVSLTFAIWKARTNVYLYLYRSIIPVKFTKYMLIQLIEAKNETPANSIDPTIDFKEHNWALGRCSDGTIFQFLQWSALAPTQYEALVDSFIFSPSPCGHYCICTVQGGISCYCSTFLMLRLMSLLHTSISFQIKSRIISLGMENNLVFSHCLFSFVLLSLSLSFKHTLTRSHTYTTTPSPPACGVTNFSWALDFSLRETEKEKMKERAEAVVHWQLRGSHPH